MAPLLGRKPYPLVKSLAEPPGSGEEIYIIPHTQEAFRDKEYPLALVGAASVHVRRRLDWGFGNICDWERERWRCVVRLAVPSAGCLDGARLLIARCLALNRPGVNLDAGFAHRRPAFSLVFNPVLPQFPVSPRTRMGECFFFFF